jgi:hypothetical protein
MNASSILFVILLCAALAGSSVVSAASPPPQGDGNGYYQLLSNAEGSGVYFDSTYEGQIRNGQIIVPVDTTTTSFKTYTLLTSGGDEFHGYIPETPLPGKTIILHGDMPLASPEKTGSLTIISDPPGASVYIDGAFAGKIPLSGILQLPNYKPGNHSVELRLGGFQTYGENSVVYQGAETVINATLNQSVNGSVDFISFPKGALVFLDGTYKGITPLHVENISYGAHEAGMTLEGYQDWNALLLAKPDVTVPVTARLVPLSFETVTQTTTRTKLDFPIIPLIISILAASALMARKKT